MQIREALNYNRNNLSNWNGRTNTGRIKLKHGKSQNKKKLIWSLIFPVEFHGSMF